MAYQTMAVADILGAYAAGRRDFRNVHVPLSDGVAASTGVEQVQLEGVTLAHADFWGGSFGQKANLRHADLRGTRLGFHYLNRTDLSGADLRRAELFHVVANAVILEGADLREASLVFSELRGARLSRALLMEADLSGSDLQGATLDGADLTGARIAMADLRRVSLDGVNIDRADLSNVSLDHDVDLLRARWISLRFGRDEYSRDDIESGRCLLPIGGIARLRFVFDAHERLSAEDLAAARDLAAAFGSAAKGVRIVLELSAIGERLLIESQGDYATAARAGLACLQATMAVAGDAPGHPERAEVQAQLDQVTELMAMTNLDVGVVRRDVHELRLALGSLLRRLEPAEIQFPTDEATRDFAMVAAQSGVASEALTFGDRAARFARGAKRRAVAAEPAILALLAGALAEAVQPGTFSIGVAAGRVVADASTTPNPGDEDGGKPAGSRDR